MDEKIFFPFVVAVFLVVGLRMVPTLVLFSNVADGRVDLGRCGHRVRATSYHVGTTAH